jgi:solute carrier family 25 carnitine/acylcarnitine transporter 20/29
MVNVFQTPPWLSKKCLEFRIFNSKTKMQAEAAYKQSTVMQTAAGIFRNEGIPGFYRGFVPPLVGSMFYRGLAFSAYSGTYSSCSRIPTFHEPIPFTGGLRPCVLIAAFASAVVRATIESPLDFIKLRYQLGERVMHDASKIDPQMSIRRLVSAPIQTVRHLYTGYIVTFCRTMGLLCPFFVLIDYSIRYIPDVVNAPMIGPFFKGGICSTAAWAFAFPFETAKSVIQADTSGRYKNLQFATWKVLHQIYSEGGVRGLYRGFGPGAGRSFVANGASMLVYSWFQDTVRDK